MPDNDAEKMDCVAFEKLNRARCVIRLSGLINSDMNSCFARAQREFYELKDAPREVAIVLCTRGGSMPDGMALYNAIDSFRKGGVDKLWLIGQGMVGSMGVHILPAQPDPKFRLVFPHTTLYHHEKSLAREVKLDGGLTEHDYDIVEHMALVKRCRDQTAIMTKLLARATGQTKKALNALERNPRHLSARESVKLGFYGSILR